MDIKEIEIEEIELELKSNILYIRNNVYIQILA